MFLVYNRRNNFSAIGIGGIIKIKRKWLSLLLALALVFSLAPAMALAEEQTVTDAAGLQAAIADTRVNKIIVSGDITLDDNTSFAITRPITIVGQDGSTPTITVNCSANINFALIDFQNGSAGSVLQNINFVLNTSPESTIKRAYIVRFNNYTNTNTDTTSGITISNVGFSSKNSSASGILGIAATGGSTGGNIQVSNCTFDNFSYAVYLDNISNFTFSNNKVSNTMYNAINVGENGGSNITITNNTFTNISTAGYDAEMYSSGIRVGEMASSISITSNTIQMDKGKLPLSVDSASSTTITDLTWEADADSPITSAVINALPEGTTIKLTENVELDAMLDIQQDGITLDLNSKTITASQSFPTVEPGDYENDKHLINVSGKNVTIMNGTLQTTASNKHALNIYGASGFNLENMTLDHTTASKGAPMVVNGSTVMVSGELKLVTGENSWYGMNIDNKVNNVATNSSVTFAENSNLIFEGSNQLGIYLEHSVDDSAGLDTFVSVAFKNNVDVTPPVGVQDFVVVAGVDNQNKTITDPENAGLGKKDENGDYILAQNPEVTPPTPPTSGGGSDDTRWPNILQHPQSVSAPAGSLATFSVVANGGPLSYQWQVDRRDGKGFVSIPGATGATLTVGPVTGAENGYQYRCAVTLYGATMYSGAGQLFVTAGMIPKTGDMPGSPALLLALAGLGLAAWVVARRRAG